MNINKRNIVLLLLFVFLIGLIGAFAGLKFYEAQSKPQVGTEQIDLTSGKQSDGNFDDDMEKIKQVYDLIDENYIEDVEESKLIEGAIDGMLETLDAPYSSYMTSEATE